MCKQKNIAILLATFNGAKFLSEQIDSILFQEDVSFDIYISDDGSTDNTLSIVDSYRVALNQSLILLPPPPQQFGSAGLNFFRLIRDVDADKYEYFAFSDQDDIWASDKLSKAIQSMELSGASGYSSSVFAFWPNGRRKLIKKSAKQMKFDYYFEGPGPGCTFVLNRDLFRELKVFVIQNWELMQEVHYHDWFIYAFARSRGRIWHIESTSHMLYRQHSDNHTGANSGVKAVLWRARKMYSLWARDQVYLIGRLLGYEESLAHTFQLNPIKFFFLMYRIQDYRRTIFGRFSLILFTILGKMQKPDVIKKSGCNK